MTKTKSMSQTLALLYHEVIDDYSESGFQNKDNLAYMHKTEVFREHVNLVLKKIEENPALNYQFTFDDGGISNLKSARILEEKGLKGIYFITTKRIGTPGFLSEEDIRTLRKEGHTIGTHSHTHPMIFRALSYGKMLEEWKVSKDILEEILGEEILYASVPGGDSDQKTYDSAAEVGLKFIYDSEPIVEKRNLKESEIYGRFSVKAQTSHQQLEEMLTLKNLSSLQRNRKIKGAIKRFIFPIHQFIQNKKNEQ
jgi:peptidoglycan/xylan/chitin deacetylase (PgdA/CDA1 family)